jgi:NADP-dependent 3-hydroxy acid dehydrogenase YdfG
MSTENAKDRAKVVAITGASGGIGAATARPLASKGASVVLAALDDAKLAELAHAIKAAGGEAMYRRTDVTSSEEVRLLVESSTQRFGCLDVMANIAGIAINSPLRAGKPPRDSEVSEGATRGPVG